jgi:hypothetical protein
MALQYSIHFINILPRKQTRITPIFWLTTAIYKSYYAHGNGIANYDHMVKKLCVHFGWVFPYEHFAEA